MLKKILKTFGLFVCLLVFNTAHALWLGGAVVSSYLGQPLRAEIELVAVDKSDQSSIQAKLASAEDFKRAGIDYPYGLPPLNFEVVDWETGRPRLRISSAQPINEPFLTLLIEVAWPSGKLMREYTFLLDPVGLNQPAQPAEIVLPSVPVSSVTDASVAAESEVTRPRELPESIGETVITPAAPKKESPAPAVSDGSSQTDKGYKAVSSDRVKVSKTIKVMRGDTLSKIARENKPIGVSLERMLLALYLANPDAFVGKNMNRLMAGKILRLPDTNEIVAIDQTEARREYRAHVRDWNAYRQRLAAQRPRAVESVAENVASGKVSASVAEPAITAEPAKEVLKLSKAEAPGSEVGTGVLSSEEEDAVAREKALQDAQERAALLEKNIKDLERLAELKKQQAATTATSDVAASASVATAKGDAAVKPAEEQPAAALAGQPGAASAEKPVIAPSQKPTAKPAVPAPLPVTETPEPSFLDELLENPALLGAAVLGVLLLLGGGLWLSRRRATHSAQSVDDEEVSEIGRIVEPETNSLETGDFTKLSDEVVDTPTPSAVPVTSTTPDSDEIDPLAEADLFLSFGRDVQAEEVLKNALSSRPGDLPILLKLLTIYANRKDANAFLAFARQVKDSGDKSAWNQVCLMGRELDPNNPLYRGAGEIGFAPSATTTKPSVEPTVDFVLDLDEGEKPQSISLQDTQIMDTVALVTEDKKAELKSLFGKMGSQISEQEKTAILSPDELRAVQEMPVDFDIAGPASPSDSNESSASVESRSDENMLEFDVTLTNSDKVGGDGQFPSNAPQKEPDSLIFDIASPEPDAQAADHSKADELLEFTLDFPERTGQSESPKQPSENKQDSPLTIDLTDINLDLGGETVSGLAATAERMVDTPSKEEERWQEVATKLDLAKAYQDMGDTEGAREILQEVLRDGDAQQRAKAQSMLDQL